MNPIAEAAEAQRLAIRAMTGLRVIPVTPLGHSADCLICAAVDRWVANRRKPLRASAETPTVGPGAPHAGRVWLGVSADVRRRTLASSG